MKYYTKQNNKLKKNSKQYLCGDIMLKCLVVGGAGFIGSNLVEKLVENKHDVVVIDNLFFGTKDNLKAVEDKIQFYQTDLTKAHKNSLFQDKKFDFVFLMGNYSSAPMFYTDTRDRIDETLKDFLYALELAKDNKAKFIYASSSSIQGPRTYYSGIRETYEILASMYYVETGLNSIGFRFFSIYGGDKYHETHKTKYANVISQFYWKFKEGKNFEIFGDGSQSRDFIHVLDVVEATVKAMEYDKPGAFVFEVGTEIDHSFNDIFQMLTKVMKLDFKPIYIVNPIKNYVQKTLSTESKETMKELNWKPKISLKDGISMMVD